MIRFINIDNGRVYNGDMPYVHWFDDQQSIDLIYVKRLCVLSDTESLHVSIPDNPVFRLLDTSKICNENTVEMNQVKYQDLTNMYCNELDLDGVPYDRFYVYMIYIVGSSDTAIEARQEFTINDKTFIVGADFYEEREELKINLGNFGIEIPESIQRAIYPSNVHEEAKDNILLNRKYKELLMDYIDVLGNKGSYSSLINSLHWFEYGDLLSIKEFWKHKEWERIIYNDQEFTQILTNKAKHLLTNFAKTTYIGLYLAMQREARGDENGANDIQYEKEVYPNYAKYDYIYNAQLDKSLPQDLVSTQHTDKDTLTQIGVGRTYVENHPDEHTDTYGANWRRYSEWYSDQERILAEPVPALEKVAYMWSRTDLSVKMALLGNFYETYFMPVHLDLIHATIEDLVYTNAIKVIPLGDITRVDHFESLNNVQCNIKDGQVFLLGDVTANVNKETIFYTPWTDTKAESETYDYDIHHTIGVDHIDPNAKAFGGDEDAIKNFMVNYYQGPGVIIPFEFVVPVSEGDLIHKTVLSIENDNTGEWDTVSFGTVFSADSDDPTHIHIKFNLLCTRDRTYDIRIQFVNTNSQSYVKKINFDVADTRRVGLTVYRMKPILARSFNDIVNDKKREAGDYMFSHGIISLDDLTDIQKYYTQFIPAYKEGRGARLNNLLVLAGHVIKDGVPTDIMEVLSDNLKILLASKYYIMSRNSLVQDPDDEDNISVSGDIMYYVLISNSFDFELSPERLSEFVMLEQYYNTNIVLRNEQIFIPQFHYLEPIDIDKGLGDISPKDFEIGYDETVVVVPDIRFLKNISEYEWVFHNASTLEDINLNSVKEPIIAYTEQQKPLSPGYYDVIFRYKLSSEKTGPEAIHEVILKSAFVQTK